MFDLHRHLFAIVDNYRNTIIVTRRIFVVTVDFANTVTTNQYGRCQSVVNSFREYTCNK